MIHIDVLGKNHYALSMIFETAKSLHEKCFITIYTNMDDSLNKTRMKNFALQGVPHKVLALQDYTSNSNQTILAGMSPKSRKVIWESFQPVVNEENLSPLIHPRSVIASSVELGKAVRIEPAVVMAPFACLGFGVMLNRNSSIGHHTIIGDYTNINPGAIVNGDCNIGNMVTIGSGAIINDGISIGDGSMIGSGSVVTKDIPPAVLAIGIPAKVVKDI